METPNKVECMLQESELPAWMLTDLDALDTVVDASGSSADLESMAVDGAIPRAARRAEVNYVDNLSEAQFLRAVEEGNYGDIEDYYGGPSGRKRPGSPDSDSVGGEPPTKRGRGRPAGKGPVAGSTPSAVLKHIQVLVEKLLDYEDDDGRVCYFASCFRHCPLICPEDMWELGRAERDIRENGRARGGGIRRNDHVRMAEHVTRRQRKHNFPFISRTYVFKTTWGRGRDILKGQTLS